MMVTSLSSLPFEIHVHITRYLELRDALHYTEVLHMAFDAVYYVFSHRNILDFSSTLNKDGFIDLTEEQILSILHAHTRATIVRYLALPPT